MNGEKITKFKELRVCQESHKLALELYTITKAFPKEEIYGISLQLKRSTTSVPANIVEGMYRYTTKELVQFLYNAIGSTGETLSHLILAKDLGYLKKDDYKILFQEYESIAKQLNGWINSLKKKENKHE